jgi:two-component system sensor histidine kinase CpxA
MKLRFPLSIRILLWFVLNLLFLGVVFYGFSQVQFRFGLDSLLMGRAGDRIQAVSEVIAYELNSSPQSGWSDILKRLSAAYQIQFFLFRNDAEQAAGETIVLPPKIRAKVAEIIGPGPRGFGGPGSEFRPEPRNQPRRGQPPGQRFERPLDRPFPQLEPPRPRPHPKFMLHTPDPSRYWVLVRIPVDDPERPRPPGMTLVAMSDSIRGSGLFFDFLPWIAVGFGVVFVSVLFWLPLVRGITRSVSRMTHATEQIALGSFDVRVNSRRTDELGSLSRAIDRMAGRLAGFVTGQKRFLGDIAHELCSPIARIQVALAILQERGDPKQKTYVDDVREEVEQISQLVNELLSFSKAGLQQKEIKLVPVNLSEIGRRVANREARDAGPIEIQIDDSLEALAEPELLARALANIIRNAIRYGGNSGQISIAAQSQADHVTLTVSDQGPGVPEEMLGQIFDPFFRLEASRSRETGGIGLGLAIVKTCLEACQGTVTARNRHPSGLQVEMTLKPPPRL